MSLLRHVNLPELGLLAHQARLRSNPDPVVTYILGGSLPVSAATASGSLPWSHLLQVARLGKQIGLAELCLYPDSTSLPGISDWERLLPMLHDEHETLACGLPGQEISRLAVHEDVSAGAVLQRLQRAGLGMIRGEDGFPAIGLSLKPAEWLDIHRSAHDLGIRTTACIPGSVSGSEEIVNLLLEIREEQDRTGLFCAMMTGASGRGSVTDPVRPAPARPESPGSFHYLRMVATCRCVLDNVPRLQAAWEEQGSKIGEVALRFGADDFGSTGIRPDAPPDRNPAWLIEPREIERLIRDSGFRPYQRDAYYQEQPDDRVQSRPESWTARLPLI